MKRHPWTRWFAAVSLLVLAACASPTLPLPPPDAPFGLVADATAGEWTVSGSCIRGALVTVFNEDTGEGEVIEDRDQDGLYEVKLKGQPCDTAWVLQMSSQQTSAPTTFVLAETANGLPVDPAACK